MRNPTVAYTAPFLLFLVFLSLDGKLGLAPEVEYPVRVIFVAAAIWYFSRGVLSFKTVQPAITVGVGILVFVLWVAPDLLFPGYRAHWLFSNSLTGAAPTPAGGYQHLHPVAILFRVIRAVIIVPIVEELFWRAWIMRWLIKPDFLSLPLGAYNAQAFWITAVLFALEHGAFWDVGLIAGVLYNLLMVRTRSLGDCILAHAITNGILSAYVIYTGKWQYW
ncbi:MAG: CAAX prenyl protease-related protein [Acidobacteria bacterium]|nr:CAAX prenyl protease-related protein [Acidobacteriota bacterium]